MKSEFYFIIIRDEQPLRIAKGWIFDVKASKKKSSIA